MGYSALHGYARGGSAVSTEAAAVREAASKVVEFAERSQVLFGEKSVAISQLWTLANDCDEQGWDGYDASAINQAALFTAEQFLRALPHDIPIPEFAAEPDGSISLDWIVSRNRLFSLSVGANNRLAYAWLDGADRGHAVARFDGNNVPARVLEGIKEIGVYGNASLRAA